MSKQENIALKAMMEGRNEGYGVGQSNTTGRYLIVIDTLQINGYYGTQRPTTKEDLTLILHHWNSGMYFNTALIKSPGSRSFVSYASLYGRIPSKRTETDLKAEAARKLERARAEAGWDKKDYERGYESPIIENIGRSSKAGAVGAVVAAPIMLLGVAIIALWYFLFRGQRG